MASAPPSYPWILYHPTEGSRLFASAEELRAAGRGWTLAPPEAVGAAAPPAEPAPDPEAEPAPEATEESTYRPRSRR